MEQNHLIPEPVHVDACWFGFSAMIDLQKPNGTNRIGSRPYLSMVRTILNYIIYEIFFINIVTWSISIPYILF